jgi:sec-independent protein translocase protein TatA
MGLGWTEWLVILLIVVLLFGARKLPELAHSMGTSIQAFKKGMKDSQEPPPAAPPAVPPHEKQPEKTGANGSK